MQKTSKALICVSCLLVLSFLMVIASSCSSISSNYTSGSAAPAASSTAAASAAPEAAAPAEAPAADADYYSDTIGQLNEQLEQLESQQVELSAQAKKGADTSSSTLTNAPAGRKIITTIDIRMESVEYNKCAKSILEAVKRANGYIEYSDLSGGIVAEETRGISYFGLELSGLVKPVSAESYYSNNRRYMQLKIRVPQNGLSDFMSEIEGFGHVLSKQESAEDVTLKYVDIESHKKALSLEQERLLDMLGKAENVEDMIKLEERLSEVRYNLERYESQMRVLENQISYSTVNLVLDEVLIYTEKPEDPIPKPTVSQRISLGMSQTFDDIGNYWVNVFVWFMVNLVYIIGFVFASAIVFIILRRHYRRFREKPLAGKISIGSEKISIKRENPKASSRQDSDGSKKEE